MSEELTSYLHEGIIIFKLIAYFMYNLFSVLILSAHNLNHL